MGAVVLKRLADAQRAGDNIRAVIRPSGTNNGITLPSRQAQEELARIVYRRAALDPHDTPYIEAHGTGTEAGDVIETTAIANVFAAEKCVGPWVGSVKPNVGHTESASGIAGLIKSVLMLEHCRVPPQLNLAHLEPELQKLSRRIKVRLNCRLSRQTMLIGDADSETADAVACRISSTDIHVSKIRC